MKGIKKLFPVGVIASAFLIAVNIPAQTTDVTAVKSDSPAAVHSEAPNMRIGPGDLLHITVFDVPELTTSVRVSNDGTITLPLIGILHAAGITSSALQAEIRTRLIDGQFVNDPQVNVSIDEYATQGVSVLGEVMKPGTYKLIGPHRLTDMIAAASGFTNMAGKTVTIYHQGSETPEVVHMSNNAPMNFKDNPVMRPGDTVVVNTAGLVYVMGSVTKPGGFPIDPDEHMTALQALSLAGGEQLTAKMSQVYLIRRNSNGVTEMVLNMKKIIRGQEADVAIANGDIMFIPNSTQKQIGQLGIASAFEAVVGAAIYRTW